MGEQFAELALDDDNTKEIVDKTIKKKKELENIMEQKNAEQSEETSFTNNEEEINNNAEGENFGNNKEESGENDEGTSGGEDEEEENDDLSLLIEQNHLELVNSIDLQRQLLFR